MSNIDIQNATMSTMKVKESIVRMVERCDAATAKLVYEFLLHLIR